jgi:site-specific DNA-cytosine methylase
LQAFPTDHPWGEATKKARYAAIGDAVPPPLAEALARQIAMTTPWT